MLHFGFVEIPVDHTKDPTKARNSGPKIRQNNRDGSWLTRPFPVPFGYGKYNSRNLWYYLFLKKRASGPPRPSKKGAAAQPPSKAARGLEAGPVIGRQRFAKISAVEGIVLSDRMSARVAELDQRGASAAERRAAIIRAHRKG